MASNFRALVYGVITIGALLGGENGRFETYGKTVLAIGLAILLYWIAHSYSELAGRRLEDGTPLTLSGLAQAMRSEFSIVSGAAVPLAVVLASWAIGVKLSTAVNTGAIAAAAMILLIEVVAGVRADLSGKELVKQASIGAVLGLLVLAVNTILH